MDPITLATVTSAVTVLATEAAKAGASEIGKDVWNKIKSLLGWSSAPPAESLAPTIAAKLQNNEALARAVIELLQKKGAGASSALVANLNAEKVIVIQTNSGQIIM